MRIIASVFISDDESGLRHDYEAWLEKLAPHGPVSQYRHRDTGQGLQRRDAGRSMNLERAVTHSSEPVDLWH